MRIQLFRQKLSNKGVKAYATMPIGIMGSKNLVLLDRGSRCRARRKEEVCAVSFYTLKHIELQSWNLKIPITHNHFRHCRVIFSSFVRQPFSKQLYKVTFTEKSEMFFTLLHVHRTDMEDMSEVVEHRQLLLRILKAFPECNETKCNAIYHDVLKCVGNKRYVS